MGARRVLLLPLAGRSLCLRGSAKPRPPGALPPYCHAAHGPGHREHVNTWCWLSSAASGGGFRTARGSLWCEKVSIFSWATVSSRFTVPCEQHKFSVVLFRRRAAIWVGTHQHPVWIWFGVVQRLIDIDGGLCSPASDRVRPLYQKPTLLWPFFATRHDGRWQRKHLLFPGPKIDDNPFAARDGGPPCPAPLLLVYW